MHGFFLLLDNEVTVLFHADGAGGYGASLLLDNAIVVFWGAVESLVSSWGDGVAMSIFLLHIILLSHSML